MLYTIKKGRHSSGWRFHPYWHKDQQAAFVQFTPSCAYTLPGSDQADTNKLYGLSFGLHTRWSARWGWKSRGENSDTILLVPYMHERGEIVRPQGRLEVPINEDVALSIRRKGRTVIFEAGYSGGSVSIVHEMSGDPWHCGYDLFFYFGGNCVAPHDVSLYLDLQ